MSYATKYTPPTIDLLALPESEEKANAVYLREIIESEEFGASSSPVTLAVGKDTDGNAVICHLEKMPHLLVGGATDGNSAFLNSAIISLLYKSSPEDVCLVLIDPEHTEFNAYEGIPHLLDSKIITDVQQAIDALSRTIEEMECRYALFMNRNVRNITEFNKSDAVAAGEENKLPYIVIIVSELAGLILGDSRKTVEQKIMSLAQKARAAGIHLIMATQRPSVDVITGTVKANLPSRIAFAVNSKIDSRILLDECGAETLSDNGDMLYSPVGLVSPKRVRCAAVTDSEIADICKYVRENN